MNAAVLMNSDAWLETIDCQPSIGDWSLVSANRVPMERLMQWENILTDYSITYDWYSMPRLELPVMHDYANRLVSLILEQFEGLPFITAMYYSEEDELIQLWAHVTWEKYNDAEMNQMLAASQRVKLGLSEWNRVVLLRTVPIAHVNPFDVMPDNAKLAFEV